MGLSSDPSVNTLKRRIGVFGGTFDPIHRGHIETARFALENGELEFVLMVPAGKPWLRDSSPTATPEQRLQMTRLAVADEAGLQVSNLDVAREGVTYTADLIAELRSTYGDETELVLVLGADSARQMHRWHRADQLRSMCSVLVIGRPGEEWEEESLSISHPARGATFLRGPMIDVSATELRERLAAGADVSDSVPVAVARYIQDQEIYKTKTRNGEKMVQTASNAERLLGRAKELGALKFGDFTLASGQKSTYYFDGRQLSLDPEGASIISDLFLEKISEAGCEAAGGPTVAAVPIVGSLMMRAWQEHVGITGFFVRPEAKGHGMGRQVEGGVKPGMKVAVFDDTVSTGGSLLEAVDAIQAFGCEVALVLCVLDRSQGGSDEVKRRGIPFVSFWEATPEGEVRVTAR